MPAAPRTRRTAAAAAASRNSEQRDSIQGSSTASTRRQPRIRDRVIETPTISTRSNRVSRTVTSRSTTIHVTRRRVESNTTHTDIGRTAQTATATTPTPAASIRRVNSINNTSTTPNATAAQHTNRNRTIVTPVNTQAISPPIGTRTRRRVQQREQREQHQQQQQQRHTPQLSRSSDNLLTADNTNNYHTPSAIVASQASSSASSASASLSGSANPSSVESASHGSDQRHRQSNIQRNMSSAIAEAQPNIQGFSQTALTPRSFPHSPAHDTQQLYLQGSPSHHNIGGHILSPARASTLSAPSSNSSGHTINRSTVAKKLNHRRSNLFDVNANETMNIPEANLTDVQDTQVSDSDLVERIRCWRHDAMQQHLYDSAIFWGDKVVSMTNDPNDIFWLAQVYYLTGQYVRVEKLLTRKHLLNSSVACRFLAAQCMTKLKKWQAALEILGETNPFTRMNGNGQVSQVKNAPEGIKLEASMCYLRGQVYLEQENVKRAKECFKEALKTDIKCYEAYQALVINQMMKQTEEQEFLSSLDFTQLREEDAKFVRSIYTIKQRMPSNNKELLPLKRTLEEEYGLVNNVDVELSIADSAFARGRFKDCLTITKGLLKVEQYHPTVLTTHIACLYELRDQHRLFHLGKELVDRFPELPVTWFCVGCYYFSVKKTTEARRYFKKSSQMDTNYGPARIGYAHTFAEEGEYDQAIQEYSSADRLFPGSHFPTLFIGMQLLKQKNLSVAQEYLLGAAELGPSDALLNNELAVLYYEQKEYEKSIEHFNMALDMIKEMEYDASVENDIWSNLGQAHRRLGNYEEAKKCFIKLKTRCPRRADAYTGLGYVHHAMGDIEKAIEYYHQALGLSSNNPLTTELLNMAIQEQVDGGLAKIASYDEVSFSLDDLPSDTLSIEGTEQRPLTASLNAFMSSHQQHTSNNGDNDDHVEGVDQQDDYHHIDSESSGTDMSFD